MEQVTSNAAQVIIAVIPIVGIVAGCAVVFAYLLWAHKRRMLLIKSGQYQKPHVDLINFSLLTGLLLGLCGLALTVFFGIIAGRTYALLGGIIPLSLGVGLLAYYFIARGR
jgi:hypothetical protein